MDNNFFITVKFSDGGKPYTFATSNSNLLVGDYVVVNSATSLTLAKVSSFPISIEKYSSTLELKPIVRVASSSDIKQHNYNLEDARLALTYATRQAQNLNLKMDFISAEYAFDRSKLFITYSAEERVDFRELVKLLGSHLKTRVELRQIGSRDRAKLVGGLGICGFPLCCSTFLNEFDGISINRAKNQMLTLNIPKLSGQCGKLLCCLKYEDEYYVETRKEFPSIGYKFTKNNIIHTVTSFNMISRTVRLEYDGGNMTISIDELNKNYKKAYAKS